MTYAPFPGLPPRPPRGPSDRAVLLTIVALLIIAIADIWCMS